MTTPDSFPRHAQPAFSRRTFFGGLGAAGIGLALPGRAGSQTARTGASGAVTPFRIAVPDADLADLRARLARTRFPDKETVSDWSQGVPLAKARALVAYWRDRYDWRAFERRANAIPQFRTEIDGLRVHFLHIRSKHANALPMLLMHGWPGSFVEFMKVIGPLTDPTAHGGTAADAFHLVIPSMPGFGFSDKPTTTGWGVKRVVPMYVTLMRRLGYERWVAQGGDWGSAVALELAKQRPPGLAAAHVNFVQVYDGKPRPNPTPVEQQALRDMAKLSGPEVGYNRQQGTRPQTLGYGLADSPAGQAMWIYEKFYAWTDNRGQPEDALTLDEMLDNIALYWFTNTATSSARYYWEDAPNGPTFNAGPNDLPMAATIFPREIWRAPRQWAQQMWPRLYYWNEVDKGGHFAAFEQPAIFTQEMRKAFRTIR